MDTKSIKLDGANLKKLLPYALAIGAGLGILALIPINLGGLWDIIFIAAFAFCGGFYSQTLLKSGSDQLLNVALNGAVLAAVSQITYGIVTGVISSIRYSMIASFFAFYLFLEALIVGALAAFAWYLYKTNKK